MTTLTLETILDNELEKQTIEDMNQGSQEPASKADLRNLTVRLESKFVHIDSRITDTAASFKLLIAEKTNHFTMIIVGFGVTQLAAIAGLFLKN
jgi:hypothetical protein